MKAAVVSHGSIQNFEDASHILKSCDMIVCADGGGEYVLKCGLVPDVLIGDFDSIKTSQYDKIKGSEVKIIKYPKEKDYTDTELAVNYAVEAGAQEIIMLGSLGSRIDHSLANILYLVKLTDKGIKACIVDQNNTIYITKDSIELEGVPGDLLSLLPVGGDVTGITTKNLKYALHDSTIKLGDTVGVSNVFQSTNAKVKIKNGYLLVIKSHD